MHLVRHIIREATDFRSHYAYVRAYFFQLLLLGVACIVAYTVASYAIIYKHDQRSLRPEQLSAIDDLSQFRTGIVFGGGVTEDGPRPLLRDRLDQAAELLEADIVDRLILSGDNRFESYNEPREMFQYLVNERGVSPQVLQADFAGRSTYETCERASKIFGVTHAILVSESTHLPRALYLCKHFDITAYGVQSDGEASSGLKIGQRWREVLARDKATFNTMIWGEPTVLGDPIQLQPLE